MKLILTLDKSTEEHWNALEKEGASSTTDEKMAYPTSSRVKHDWEQLERSEEAETEEPKSVDAFFKKLYSGASEDTRRAMMKSFVSFF